jgi:hypothetical protein
MANAPPARLDMALVTTFVAICDLTLASETKPHPWHVLLLANLFLSFVLGVLPFPSSRFIARLHTCDASALTSART